MDKNKKIAATTKKSFILYNDLQPMLDKLTIPQAGHLLKAIFQYQNGFDVTDLDPVTDMAMTSIVSHFKRDGKKWEQTRVTRSESGRKGGLAKQANARGAKQNKQDVANLAVSVSDSVSESENDITTSPSQAPAEEDKKLLQSKPLLNPEPPVQPPPPLPHEAVTVAHMIANHVQRLDAKAKNLLPANYSKTVQSWAEDIDKLHRLDGRSWDEIRSVWNWTSNDDFWRTNVKSGSKLRAQFSNLYIKSNDAGGGGQKARDEAIAEKSLRN